MERLNINGRMMHNGGVKRLDESEVDAIDVIVYYQINLFLM